MLGTKTARKGMRTRSENRDKKDRVADKCYIWAVSALHTVFPPFGHDRPVYIRRISECHAQFYSAEKRVCSIYNACYFRAARCAFLGKLHREYRTVHSVGHAAAHLLQKAPFV